MSSYSLIELIRVSYLKLHINDYNEKTKEIKKEEKNALKKLNYSNKKSLWIEKEKSIIRFEIKYSN